MKKKLLASALAFTALMGTIPAIPAAADDEPVHIVMECLYFDQVPRDLQAVEDALNEITIPEINVEVELYPLGFMDAAQQVGLMISSGDQLDLIVCIGRSDFLSLVNKNMLLELDDLLEEYGPNIKEVAANLIGGGYVGETLYGIPSVEQLGRTYGLIIAKEAADAAGWDKWEGVTLDEMSDFLAKAHEAFPDKALIQMSGGAGNVTNWEYFEPVDYLGADAACGGIMGIGEGEGNEIVNVFATEEYANFVKVMHEWYQAGYINQDAATCTESNQSFVSTGNALGYFLYTNPGMVRGQGIANGVEMVGIDTRDHYLVQGDIATQTWSIPYTCTDPEAAMKFLDLTYSNLDVINLLYYGIEGLDYRKLDDGRFDYLEGENAQTVGFHQWFGLYGDVAGRDIWSDQTPEYKEELAAYNAEINESNTTKYYGYAFNPDVVKTQYAAVNDVISTYRTSLECGVVDPETVLPQFISALESAGINDIIAANQEALDAWVADQAEAE